jgi:hypothetical protein
LVTSIGSSAFYECTNLTAVSFPDATAIGERAFDGCTSLETADFPLVTSIEVYAFQGCTSLTTASFPTIRAIRSFVFNSTGGTALTIIMGNTPPTVGIHIFSGVGEPKSVTVKVPYAAVESYDTPTWRSAFRGKGSDGKGETNSNITLTITSK